MGVGVVSDLGDGGVGVEVGGGLSDGGGQGGQSDGGAQFVAHGAVEIEKAAVVFGPGGFGEGAVDGLAEGVEADGVAVGVFGVLAAEFVVDVAVVGVGEGVDGGVGGELGGGGHGWFPL